MKHIWIDETSKPSDPNKRSKARQTVALPARITWKDQRGAARFATVVARNVSDVSVYVESPAPLSIPLYRLVQFQLEREGRDGAAALPGTLQRAGRVLSAVYRVSPPSASKLQGLALRLMVDPHRAAAPLETLAARATA